MPKLPIDPVKWLCTCLMCWPHWVGVRVCHLGFFVLIVFFFPQEALQGPTQPKEAKRTSEYSIVREVHDRSFLSDEMAIMCAKQRIFYMEPESVTVDVQKQTNRKRKVTEMYLQLFTSIDRISLLDEGVYDFDHYAL